MSVESIIDRIPEPRAVQELIAAARDLEAELDSLRDRLRQTIIAAESMAKLGASAAHIVELIKAI